MKNACAVLVLLAAGLASADAHKILIDTDPGTDDALAILLALNSPELQVAGISVVAGNVTVERGLENALGILALAGRCDVPVARGAGNRNSTPSPSGTVSTDWGARNCRDPAAAPIRVSEPT